MIYSGGEDHKKGVGIILRNEVAKSMIGYWPISDTVVMVKLQAKSFNINLIQVYAPTQDYDDENIEEFFEQIQLPVSYTKPSDIICIMGNLNAKVGNVTDFNIIGFYLRTEESKLQPTQKQTSTLTITQLPLHLK